MKHKSPSPYAIIQRQELGVKQIFTAFAFQESQYPSLSTCVSDLELAKTVQLWKEIIFQSLFPFPICEQKLRQDPWAKKEIQTLK